MELSVKKLNRAVENYIGKEQYKYNPYKLNFEQRKECDYIVVDRHYIMRIDKAIIPQILATNHQLYCHVDNIFMQECNAKNLAEYEVVNVFERSGTNLVDLYNKKKDNHIYIQEKFLKQFYNKPITKYEDCNIKIKSAGNKKDKKKPVIIYKNNIPILLVLPVLVK